MELVGKTLEDEETLVLLGVSPFNKVYGSGALEQSKYLNIHDYHAPKKGQAADPSLDPNHTHHILVAGVQGANGKFGFGDEIETRNLIEEAVCQPRFQDADEGADGETTSPTSPMVLLVVGGGYGTVSTVLAALRATDGSTACPVVLVPEAKGAGLYIHEAVHQDFSPQQVAEPQP